MSSYFATTFAHRVIAQLAGAHLVDAAQDPSSSSANSCVSSRPSAGRSQSSSFDVLAGEQVDAIVEQLFGGGEQVAAHVRDLFLAEVNLAFEDLAAQRVDTLTLLVHHVVVFEQVLADGEVLRFDLLLRALDGARHHAVLDRHAFFHAEALHQAGDAIRAEDAHQVVFERQEETRRAGIALAAGAAAQLVVDAPRFVTLGADDVQAAEVDDFLVLFLGLRCRSGCRCDPSRRA